MSTIHAQKRGLARLSASLPHLEASDAPYSPVATLFRHCGFEHTQLKRVGDVAIYRQSKGRQPDAFEVVLIRRYEAYTAFGKEIPAAEFYPKSEDWGSYGFTYRTPEDALAKFEELTRRASRLKERAAAA